MNDVAARQSVDADVERALDAVLDDPKAIFRLRLLRATRQLLAERGLDISMEEIAEAANVNRRTLFRHVQSRDVLVANALTSAMDWYDRQIDPTDASHLPLDVWITSIALQLMTIHQAAGLGLWQLAATPDRDLVPELALINVRRRADRRTSTPKTAQQPDPP